MLKLVDIENEKIQDATVAALSRSLREKRVANKFLGLMDSKSEAVQVRAICAMMGYANFGNIIYRIMAIHPSKGVDEKKFVNKLWVALECESEQVQVAALWALIKLNKGEQVKERIIDAFKSESELLQLVGMYGLTKLGIKDERVTEGLLKYTESENVLIQALAGKVLGEFIRPNEEILRKLSSLLDLLRYKIIKIAAFCILLSSSHIPSFCGSPLFALSQIIPQQVYYIMTKLLKRGLILNLFRIFSNLSVFHLFLIRRHVIVFMKR